MIIILNDNQQVGPSRSRVLKARRKLTITDYSSSSSSSSSSNSASKRLRKGCGFLLLHAQLLLP
jgi:hypothetical protein